MIRHLALAATTLMFSGLSYVQASPRNPVGETASYQLDRAGARTTSMVQSGAAVGTVTAALPTRAPTPGFNISLDYDFSIQFYGKQKGTANYAFGQELFDQEFLDQLRKTGSFESADYKIKHEGYADAKNLDGNKYAHCDKILIYDIKLPESQDLEQLLSAVAGVPYSLDGGPQIENLKVRAHLFAGVPVLSAVKLDISGVVQGINAKVGMDYKKAP